MPIWGDGGKRTYCLQSVGQASDCETGPPLCPSAEEPRCSVETGSFQNRPGAQLPRGQRQARLFEAAGKQAMLCGAPAPAWPQYVAGFAWLAHPQLEELST